MKKLAFLFLILLGTNLSFSQSRKTGIYLVRHAKVDMEKPAFIGSKKASALLKTYNSSPIIDFDPQIIRDQIKADDPVIIASSMPRALQTADLVFPDDSITGYALFDEYQMGIIRLPVLHLPYNAWTGISRFLWLVHLNTTGEPRAESKKRLVAATDLLEKLADKNSCIVLFSHGYLISELRHELKKRGWQLLQNGGNKNLAVSHLEK